MSVERRLAYRHWLRNSFEWETIRLMALAKAENKCRICGHENPKNDVHHLWYRERWAKTRFWDVVVLCRRCHDRVHQLTKPPKLVGRTNPKKEFRVIFWKAELTIKQELGLAA